MRKWLMVIGLTLGAASAHAQLSLSMPYGSAGCGTDSISANGVNCSNAINGSAQFETGVLATQGTPENQSVGVTTNTDTRTGIYARILVPINPPKTRIDCSRLYEITQQRQQLEDERKQRNPDLSEFSLSQLEKQGKGFE